MKVFILILIMHQKSFVSISHVINVSETKFNEIVLYSNGAYLGVCYVLD